MWGRCGCTSIVCDFPFNFVKLPPELERTPLTYGRLTPTGSVCRHCFAPNSTLDDHHHHHHLPSLTHHVPRSNYRTSHLFIPTHLTERARWWKAFGQQALLIQHTEHVGSLLSPDMTDGFHGDSTSADSAGLSLGRPERAAASRPLGPAPTGKSAWYHAFPSTAALRG